MKYTVDPLEEQESDYDLTAPVVVEVHDIEHTAMRPLHRGGRVIGHALVAGGKFGRQRLRVMSTDPDLEGKVAGLRAAVAELRDRLPTELIPHKADDTELPTAEDEAEHWAESEFIHLLAYAALAIELETSRA